MENHGDVRQKKLKRRGQTKIVEQDHKLLKMWDVQVIRHLTPLYGHIGPRKCFAC